MMQSEQAASLQLFKSDKCVGRPTLVMGISEACKENHAYVDVKEELENASQNSLP